MAKKILVLNGSTVVHGSTDTLADYFVKGAVEAGNEAVKINVSHEKINGCRGCNGCKAGKGNPCVQKDDMEKIYTAVKNADVIVWATPLYWMQFSSQLKAVLDRFYAMNPDDLAGKETALLVAAASPEEVIRTNIVPYYKLCFIDSLKWTDKGMVLAGGVFGPGDVEKTSYADAAYELGKSL